MKLASKIALAAFMVAYCIMLVPAAMEHETHKSRIAAAGSYKHQIGYSEYKIVAKNNR